MAEIEISFSLGKLKKFLLLGLLVAVLALELNVTFNNPIAFGDEGFHVSVARYIGTEADFSGFTPLSGSELNIDRFGRPPLWNLIEGSFYFLFGFSEGIIKFLMPFISFMTGIAIYVFLRRLYSENLAIFASAISVTIPSFVTYSILFYTTVPYVFFFTMAFLSLLTAIKTGSGKFWLLAGVFSGVSMLVNIAGAFMFILAVVMGVVHILRNRNIAGFMQATKTYGLVALLTLIIISPVFVRNIALFAEPGCDYKVLDLLQGKCRDPDLYITTTTNEFVARSIAGGTEDSILSIGVTNYLNLAYGFSGQFYLQQYANNPLVASFMLPLANLVGLAFVPFAFLAGLVLVARRRETSDIAILASIAIFLALFSQIGGLVDGRAEDTLRYFLSATPLIGLVSATYWASIRKEGHRHNGLIVLFVMVLVIVLSFTSLFNKVTVMDSVKNFVPSFFQACDWVKENLPEDANLFSLHTYPTRYNCERGAIWEMPDKNDILLSNNLTLVRDRLELNGIGYIFLQKFAITTVPISQGYPMSFVELLESNNQTFERVFENGPRYGSPEFASCAGTGSCDIGTTIYRVKF